MTDTRTFSALVDQIAATSRHPGRQDDIARYINATLRELDVTGLYKRSLVEDQLTATAAPFIWEDYPSTLRVVRTVYYPAMDIYPKLKRPGKRVQQENLDEYYYAASNYYVFAGMNNGDSINIAYYDKPKLFLYYAVADRPATWSEEDQAWSYLSAGTDSEKEAARNLVTHWMLEDWRHVVEEGTKAKFFKQFGDDRAPSTFALYSQFKKDFIAGEESESLGF